MIPFFMRISNTKILIGLIILLTGLSLWVILPGGMIAQAQGQVNVLPCQSKIESAQYDSYYQCHFSQKTAGPILANFGPALGINSPSSELRLIETKYGLSSLHTRYQQVLQGYPVFNAYLSIHQNQYGAVTAIHSNYQPQLKASSQKTPSRSPAEAVRAVQTQSGITALRQAPLPQLVWYPLNDTHAILAYQIMLYAEEPLGDFLTVVDAHSNEILFQENRLALDGGTGLVYQPNPYQTQGSGAGLNDNNDAASAALNAQRISVTLQGLDSGTGLIKGEFVDLSSLNSSSLPDVDANETNRIYNYDRDDPRFEQVVIYHSIDSIQRYFHSMGFDDDSGTPNGIRDYPTLANAHWYTQDQSFYSTGDNAVHFGDGGVDDGEDADIIAHEYGHAVQFDQNALWGGGQMGAMGEGFGDYLAASFYLSHGSPSFQSAHGACVGEWDATSYSGTNPPCLRRVDGNKMYPGDLVGQVHADGEIWSRALWDIRLALGPSADAIVLEHHFALPANATMPTAALAMLQADVDLNGGANDNVIRQAFCNRGILSGANCVSPKDFSLNVSPASQKVCTPNEAVYAISLTSINNFADSVALTVTGVPTASASINPNPVVPAVPPATATLTIRTFFTGSQTLPGTLGGIYNLNVIGSGNGKVHTDTISLTILDSLTSGPALLAPVNGAIETNLTPTLSWQAATDADNYALEIAVDPAFGTIVYSATVSAISHTVTSPLSRTTVHFWRVRPENQCGAGSYSAIYSFTTGYDLFLPLILR